MLRTFVLAAFAVGTVATATATTINFNSNVSGQAVIFAANGNADATTFGGVAPVLAATFTAGTGSTLTFSGISEAQQLGCAGGPVAANTPDGSCFSGTSTNLNPVNGISGISAVGANMFLVGVFTTDATPASPPPASSSYPNAAAYQSTTYSPLLDQVFFIGDGLTGTGSGTQQVFNVPATATRLYLAFADGFNFNGNPGFYIDNVGSLSVAGSVSTNEVGPGVPEPAGMGLMVLGIAGLIGLKLRKA